MKGRNSFGQGVLIVVTMGVAFPAMAQPSSGLPDNAIYARKEEYENRSATGGRYPRFVFDVNQKRSRQLNSSHTALHCQLKGDSQIGQGPAKDADRLWNSPYVVRSVGAIGQPVYTEDDCITARGGAKNGDLSLKGKLIKGSVGPGIWLIDDKGERRHVASMDVFKACKLDLKKVQTVNKDKAFSIKMGSPLRTGQGCQELRNRLGV